MNDILKAILEKSESKVINESMIQEVTKAFNEEVEKQATLKVNEKLDAERKVIEEGFDTMLKTAIKSIELDNQEKFNEAVDTEVEKQVKDKTDEVEAELKDKATKELDELKTLVIEKADFAIKTFVDENSSKWKDEVDVAKAKSMDEDFKELFELYGFKKDKLDESDEVAKVNVKLDESIKKINELNTLILDTKRTKAIDEAKAGLTTLQIDKFVSLIEGVEYVNESSFDSKVKTMLSAIGEVVDVKKVDEKIVDKKQSTYVPSINK